MSNYNELHRLAVEECNRLLACGDTAGAESAALAANAGGINVWRMRAADGTHVYF